MKIFNTNIYKDFISISGNCEITLVYKFGKISNIILKMATFSSDSESSGDHSNFDNDMTPIQASQLRKNDIVVLKGKPCRLVEINTSKPGKHGHSKIHFVGLDIFTGKKLEDLSPSSKNMMLPKIVKKVFL
jgi:hypothetical protein